jgi:hypothetical protein
MFKTFHLGVSKFGFLSLCPIRIENPNGMSIYSKTINRFGNSIGLESGVKLELRRILCTEGVK